MVVRYYTIMHIAMFDAVNSIQRRYTPFFSDVPASSGASSEAAAAQAAHDVLVALIPGSGPKATFDAALNARLATIPAGRARQGMAIGKAAAARVLAWRANDGIFITTTPPPYVLPLIPGLWQPAPTGPAFTHLPNATPFTMESITQFAVPRHPELNSARYAADYEEVRLIGRIDSATRTAAQTETAKLWAAFQITPTNLMFVWNHVVRDVTLSRNLSLLESARLYAFVNATINDSLLNTFTGKFSYGLWRPFTAIRRGGEDFNDATVADGAWSPLLGTPPYPTYPGTHGRCRCVRGQCPRTRAWPGQYFVLSDVGCPFPSRPGHPAHHPPVLQLLATGAGGGGQPDLWRHPLPFRQRGEPGSVRQTCPACVLEVHGAAVGRYHATNTTGREAPGTGAFFVGAAT